MGAAWRISRKDLVLRLRDRSAIMLGVVVPLVLAFVFNLVFGGAFGNGSLVTLGFADADGGDVAIGFSELVDALDESGTIDVVRVANEAELESAVDEGKVAAGISVPSGFSEEVLAGGSAEITVLQAVDAPTAGAIARGIADGFGASISDAQRAVAAVVGNQSGPPDPASIEQVAAAASQAPPVVTIGVVESADRVLDPSTFFAAGMAAFFVFFLVQFGVAGLLEEERDGTLTRLEAAPIPRWAAVVGKGMTSLILGVAAMTVLAVATTLLMGASWGNPLGVGVLIVALSLAATSIVGVVAALARTPEGAGNLTSVIAVAMGMLGGTFFPVAGGNRLLEALSLATPHSWFLRGLGALQGGDGLGPALPAAGALILFAIAVGAVAAVLLRRRFV